MTGWVALVGAGPGDPGLLTLRGRDLLAEADVVVIDRLAADELLEHCRAGVEVVNAGKVPRSGHGEGMTQDEINACLVDRALAGSRVVRLKGGDPFVFGRGGEEAEACVAAGVPFEVVPGVSSAIAVPAYAGIPVTHRGLTQDMAVISGHLDPGADGSAVDCAALAAGPGTLVLLMGVKEIGKIAAKLVEHGRNGATPVAMIQWGTTARQRTVVGTLDTIETVAVDAAMKPPAVTVIGDVVRLRETLSWFERRPLLGMRVLVPRSRAQAGELSRHLRALGAEPVEVPTIAVERGDDEAMETAVDRLEGGDFSWVVFTSVNAVTAFEHVLDRLDRDVRVFDTTTSIAAVGEATERAMRSLGLRADLVPESGASGGALAAAFPRAGEGGERRPVLLPRADIATEGVVKGLSGKGWQTVEVTAYRTVLAPPPDPAVVDAVRSGGFDAVVFTSSSTVANLVTLAGHPAESTLVAVIGPQTAQACADLGMRVDVEADYPSVESLAAALAELAVSRRSAR